jgi:hypothetical protein
VRRVEIPEYAADALRVLHGTHDAERLGAVLPDERLAAHLLAPTRAVLQRAFRHVDGAPEPMRAVWMPDGFAFEVGAPGEPDRVDAGVFFAVRASRNLNKRFVALYTTSRALPVTPETTVDATLGAVCPRWRSVRAERLPPEPEVAARLQALLRTAPGEPAEDKVFALRVDDFATLRRQVGDVGGAVSVTADGLGLRLRRTPTDLVLDVRHPARDADVSFHVRPGAFGTVLEHGLAGVYLHGPRALLRDLLVANPIAPRAVAAPPPHADLTSCDALVQAARGMGLRTTYPRSEALDVLGVAYEDPAPPAAPVPDALSAYALATEARVAAIWPEALARALARRGMRRGDSSAAALGAWAALLSRAAGDEPVCLNADPRLEGVQGDLTRRWREDALRTHAAARAIGAVEWFGREVSVTHSVRDGAHTLVFAEEGAPFALSGRPFRAAAGALPAHTALCTAFARGEAPPPVPCPAAAALEPLGAPDAAGAARRLAVLDTLSASFPQFTRAARALRCVWLHSEKRRLQDAGVAGAEFCRRMCVLAQLAALPEGPHFWASVPYLRDGPGPE